MTDTANLPAELEAFARDAESRAEHGIAPVATYAAMFRKAAAALTSREAGEGECRGCEGTKRVMDIGADGKGEWVACPECAAPPPVAGEPELRCTDPDNCRRCSEDADSPHAGLPRATPAPPPPVDGKWVPLVPTPEMIERGVRGAAWHGNPIEASQRECARIYAAMLAAAPATPAATAVGDSAAWGEHGPIVGEDWLLPCDVRVYPATLIRRGCKLSTLMTALKSRADNPDPFPNADLADLAADLNEVLALADKATPGELIARVIERNEEVRDAFLIVPSIEQGRSIAGPIPMEWLADDSYHEGGPEQKAHDARFTAAAVNFLRTHRAALLGMAGDSRRLDWIADNGQAVRGVNVGRRNILAWAERAPDPQGNCRTNLRAQIDAALQAEQASQQAREGGMEHDFTTARRGAIIKPLQAGSRELLLELLLQRPNKVWNAAHEDHTILARGIVVDPIELRALAETPALPNPKEDQP